MKKLNKIAIICLAIILISAVAMTASFSWLNRPGSGTYSGGSMSVDATAVVKSESCTAKTYVAEFSNGNLLLGEEVNSSTDLTVLAKDCLYFRTKVTNSAESKNNISLSGLTLSNGTNLVINNLSPLNTTADYSDGMTLASHITVNNGDNFVDWYIYNSSDSGVTFKMTGLPVVSYYS